MNESTVAKALMGLGVTVGVIAASFGILDVQLNFPDWLIRVAMIKLSFIASAGLLTGGALVARHARRRSISEAAASRQIPEGGAGPIPDRQGLITPQAVERPQSDSTR